MNSELKSASSVKTGKNFSAKRIELGYSIDEACKKVFINKDYLIAIEKGNYSIFPSESFAKAYFNKYVLLSNTEYEELLRKAGLFTQETQRSIFEELNSNKHSS